MANYACGGEWTVDPGLPGGVMPVHCVALGRRPEHPAAVSPGAGPTWATAASDGIVRVCGVPYQVKQGDFYPAVGDFVANP